MKLPEYSVGDTVEIVNINCAAAGEVGVVTKIAGANIYVKTPNMREAQQFTYWELKHSQQKLEL